jgi:beta-alanine degradation protein BauB
MPYNDRDFPKEASMTRPWMGLAILVALAGAIPSASIAQDRALVVPGMKVLLNNDCVRAQYHDVGVGETAPMHSHPAYVVYTLAPFKALITLPDGTHRTSEHKAGEAYWNPPITHSVKNLGKTPIHNLIVEIKPAGKCQ